MLYKSISGQNQIMAPIYAIITVVFLVFLGVKDLWDLGSVNSGILPSKTGWIWLDLVLFEGVVASLGVLINRFLVRQKIIPLHQYAPFFLVCIFLLALPFHPDHLNYLLPIFFITLMNQRMVEVYNKPHPYTRILELGILLGLAIIVNPGFSVFIVITYIGLTMVKAFTWRDFIIPILGICLVFAWYIVGFVLIKNELPSAQAFLPHLSLPGFNSKLDLFQLGVSLVTVVEFIIIYRLFQDLEGFNIKERVHYWLWIWSSIFLLVTLLFFSEKVGKEVLVALLGLPSAIFSFVYFDGQQKVWKKDGLLLLLIFSVLVVRFFNR